MNTKQLDSEKHVTEYLFDTKSTANYKEGTELLYPENTGFVCQNIEACE